LLDRITHRGADERKVRNGGQHRHEQCPSPFNIFFFGPVWEPIFHKRWLLAR
jgi:hypothetical protein